MAGLHVRLDDWIMPASEREPRASAERRNRVDALPDVVAGLRAGLIYNTWPLIDGSFIPDAARLAHETPLWRNLFENTLTVQFMHRMTAYALWVLALLHALDAMRNVRRGPARAHAFVLAALMTIQAALGILTLIHQVPIGLALLHQAGAILVLTLAVVHVQRLMPRRHGVADNNRLTAAGANT